MSDELIDVYDVEGNPTGETIMKSEAHAKGVWHIAAHVWLYNDNGEVIIQLRAPAKDCYGDKWDISAAGHIGAGETPLDSAQRELEEELGLVLKKEELEHVGILKEQLIVQDERDFEHDYIYLLRWNGGIHELTLQEEEVSDVKWIPVKDLLHVDDTFVQHTEEYALVVAEIKKRLT